MLFNDGLVREILEATPDATVVVNHTGEIIYVNRGVEKVFGYSPDELKGRGVETLLPERYRNAHASQRSQYQLNATRRNMGDGRELFGRRKNGEEFPVEISLNPVQSQGGQLVISSIRDVSSRKKIQQELILARNEAERANQSKSLFLAAASHDLRQPVQTLTLLNSSLNTLLGENDLGSRVQQIVTQQRDALDSMTDLLNSLLDISKLESGAVVPDISDCAVSKIFKRMRQQFQSQAEPKGVSLIV
jgi:protein-histidine pros-kinase